jgi:hypothetical protein
MGAYAGADYVTSNLILSPLLGDKVDHGIGLLYRPASLCSLKSRYDTLSDIYQGL